jgi:hypothetical protein
MSRPKKKQPPFKYKRKGCRPKAVKPEVPRGAKVGDKVKKVPYTSVAMRPEHYYMLRELCEYYSAPLTRTTGAIIVREYCRVLAKTNPDEAAKIKDVYKHDENQAKYIIDISD